MSTDQNEEEKKKKAKPEELMHLPSNASDDQKKSALAVFENVMGSYEGHITKLVQSKGLDPAEFLMSIVNGVKRNPGLLECETKSLFGAFFMAAELGLPPNTPHQLSFVLPYKVNIGTSTNKNYQKQAQFQIGYQGWVEIFGRNSKIEYVTAELVFKNDEFQQKKFPKPDLIHNPTNGERGPRIGAYAVAKLKDSEVLHWIYMNKGEIEAIKAKSQGGGIAWKEENDPMGWMWKKCAIKQIAKILPKTDDVRLAVYAQDAEEVGKSVKTNDEGVLEIEPLKTDAERRQDNVDQKNQDVDKTTGELFSGGPTVQ